MVSNSTPFQFYASLFKRGELNFQDYDIEGLPLSISHSLNARVHRMGYTTKLHKPVHGNAYLFKIEGSIAISYLINDGKTKTWCDDDFKPIDKIEALSYLVFGVKNEKFIEKLKGA